MAEWWAEFNTDGPEIDYFGRVVERGQPALDAGCGTDRLLLPWLRVGYDVDCCDVSADMIALCRERAKSQREALRCLKRQFARTVYTTLKNKPLLT